MKSSLIPDAGMQIYRKEYRNKIKTFSDTELKKELALLTKKQEQRFSELIKVDKKMNKSPDQETSKQFWTIWGKMYQILNYVDEILQEFKARKIN